MERTRNIKKPDLILTADWHLREDTPVCWIGDFQMEQWASVAFVRILQKTYNCPVVHPGDLFHHWKPSPWLLSMALKLLPDQFYTIYGQHDLPQHNLDLQDKTGIFTLERAGKIKVLEECHYGQEPNKGSLFFPNLNPDRLMLAWHHLTYITPPFPGATGGNARSILMKYPQFDLIVTGDNHQSFSTGSNIANILVNPGSLTRQTADQIDFQPRVALWYAEDNKIVWINIPIAKDVISREHIEKVEQRDARIDAFVSSFKEDYEVGLSFEQNLEEFFNKNNVRDSVKQIIYESIE
jgi:DNA repair exonuclease SbcCD nuclease subunit